MIELSALNAFILQETVAVKWHVYSSGNNLFVIFTCSRKHTLKWERDATTKTETIVIIVLSADRTYNTQASQVQSVHWTLQTAIGVYVW